MSNVMQKFKTRRLASYILARRSLATRAFLISIISEKLLVHTFVSLYSYSSMSSSVLFPLVILLLLLFFLSWYVDHTQTQKIHLSQIPHWQKPQDKLKRWLPCFNLSCLSSVQASLSQQFYSSLIPDGL